MAKAAERQSLTCGARRFAASTALRARTMVAMLAALETNTTNTRAKPGVEAQARARARARGRNRSGGGVRRCVWGGPPGGL